MFLESSTHELLKVKAGALWDFTVVVFARQQATAKRRPDSCSISRGCEQVSVFTLESLPHEHVVLRLLNNRFVPSELLANADCLSDTLCWPFRSTPVESLALLNDVVEGSASFLKGSLIIRSVAVNDIDVIKLHSFKSIVKAFDDVFP